MTFEKWFWHSPRSSRLAKVHVNGEVRILAVQALSHWHLSPFELLTLQTKLSLGENSDGNNMTLCWYALLRFFRPSL